MCTKNRFGVVQFDLQPRQNNDLFQKLPEMNRNRPGYPYRFVTFWRENVQLCRQKQKSPGTIDARERVDSGNRKMGSKKRLPLVIGEDALLIADYFELG